MNEDRQPGPFGAEARRLRNHRVKLFEANTAGELEVQLTAWFKPGLEPDGETERRDQREMLYKPDIYREAGTWYAVVFFVE